MDDIYLYEFIINYCNDYYFSCCKKDKEELIMSPKRYSRHDYFYKEINNM
jgi:hypothetical protein